MMIAVRAPWFANNQERVVKRVITVNARPRQPLCIIIRDSANSVCGICIKTSSLYRYITL